MPALTLDYRHCDRLRPKFLRHLEVEAIALQAREQLVDSTTDAIPLAVLRAIGGLKINRIGFELYVDTDNPVHDEAGNPILGLCEYDPAAPDAALVAVCPVGEDASEELVLSTLAHELGHAIFDAPGWIVAGYQEPDLFGASGAPERQVRRTLTRDRAHLARVVRDDGAPGSSGRVPDEVYFAELRANEFMGSLLVPRGRLQQAVEELAQFYGITVHRGPSFAPGFAATNVSVSAEGGFGDIYMEVFQRALAMRFGVTPRFIRVRLQRYGLLNAEAALA